MSRRIKYQTEKKKKTARRVDIRRYRARKAVIDINLESVNELNTNTSISFISTALSEFTELTLSVSLSTLIIIEIFQESTNSQEIAVSLVKRRHESRSLTRTLSSSSTKFEKFEFATHQKSSRFDFSQRSYVKNSEIASLLIQTLSLKSSKKFKSNFLFFIITDSNQHDVESNLVSRDSSDFRNRVSIASKSITAFSKQCFFHVSNANSFTVNSSNTSTFVDASIFVEIAFSFNTTTSQRISLSTRRQTASTQLLMLSSRINNQSVSSSSFSTAHSQFASSTMQNSSIQFFEHLEQHSRSLLYIDFDSFSSFQIFFSVSSETKADDHDERSIHFDHFNNDVQENNSSRLSNDNSIVNQSTSDILQQISQSFCDCDKLIQDRRASQNCR